MARQLIAVIALFVAFGCLTQDLVQAQEAEELKRQFLEQAPGHWEDCSKRFIRLQGHYELKFVKDGKTIQHASIQLKQNEKARLLIIQSLLPGKPTGTVVAFNPNYTFQLTRTSKDRPWAISSVGDRPSLPLSKSAWFDAYESGYNPLQFLFGTRLTELIKQPTFRVQGCKALSTEANKVVEVNVDNRHPLQKKGPFTPFQAGTLTFDPDRFWALREAKAECAYLESTSRSTLRVELRDPAASLPIPRRVIQSEEVQSSEGKGASKQSWEFDYEFSEADTLPADSEFLLTAFGFPEPGSSARSTTYLWLTLAGLGCIVLAMVLGVWWRRHEPKS